MEQELSEELPGIFNWMLAGLQRLLAQDGFTEDEEIIKYREELARENNPIILFAEEEVIDNLEGQNVPRSKIFATYRGWADKNAVMPTSASKFYGKLRTVLKHLGVKFTEEGRQWIFEEVERK